MYDDGIKDSPGAGLQRETPLVRALMGRYRVG
jgi:hypothetical protein